MNTFVQIPQAPVPAGYALRDVQLEMSVKPFWDNSPATQEAVAREIFLQWLPLTRFAESISIMLWIGDGSEILEYTGDMAHEFEWGSHFGSANKIHDAPKKISQAVSDDPDHNAIGADAFGRDPEQRGVHVRSYPYREKAAKFSYVWLRDLIATLKRVGGEITGKRILVGETFDIGPEFSISRFKYEWHREICGGGQLFGGKFIRCDAKLKGDDRVYAGYPQGIPEGTPFGEFLGRQTAALLRDVPFDFLWFSNGFGFALEPWALTGAIFDGATFDAASANATAGEILEFWRQFRREAPGVHVRTRGTNLCTGIDIGSDASPIREIYAQVPGVDAPVNSPWAALDGDVGLELSGWMSHIARLPGVGYRFRYYLHDPWWLNSPYLDRYQRHPFDIYLPMAVSRLERNGAVETPCDIAFLTIDDSHGRMPVVVPIEVTAHLLHAREFAPDAPGPIVWVYPWDAQHDLVTGAAKRPDLPFFGDWFVRGLITHTVPVNTVADWAELSDLLRDHPERLRGSILLAPALPDSCGLNAPLLKFAEGGGRVLLYGPLDESPTLRYALGLDKSEPLEGDFELHGAGEESPRADGGFGVLKIHHYIDHPGNKRAAEDARTLQISLIHHGGRTVRHLPFLSAGGWSETAGLPTPDTNILAAGHRGDAIRAACALRTYGEKGSLGWVRGSLATAEYDPANPGKVKGPRLKEMDAVQFLPTEKLARALLARMGLELGVSPGIVSNPDPMLCIHRHRNAYIFSGYQPAAATELALRLTPGAPIFTGMENRIEGGTTVFSGTTGWHHECRFFVEQAGQARITCRIIPPIQNGYTLRLLVSGLKEATLRFFPEPGLRQKLEVLRDPKFPYFVGDFVSPHWVNDECGEYAEIRKITGEVIFSW